MIWKLEALTATKTFITKVVEGTYEEVVSDAALYDLEIISFPNYLSILKNIFRVRKLSSSTTCIVRAAWRITKFFARESCGQCTPCREGSGWLERILYRIEHGEGRDADLDLLLDVSDNIAPGLGWPPQQTTICVLGPSIPSSIHSGIEMFRDEFLVHVKEGACPHA